MKETNMSENLVSLQILCQSIVMMCVYACTHAIAVFVQTSTLNILAQGLE